MNVHKTTVSSQGRIILLNGTSSSGKTALARALQTLLLPEIWLHIDVDLLRRSHPDSKLVSPYADAKSAGMERILQATPACLATLLDYGNNLIVDDVFGPKQLKNYVEVFAGKIPVLFVGVRCEVAELDRREAMRADRPRGSARGLLKSVDTPGVFDLTVNTTSQTPESAAQLVVARLLSKDEPVAFKRLSEMDLGGLADKAEMRWGKTTFVNRTESDVLIFMIDIWEQPQLRHTLPSGCTHVQQMSNVHPWEVRTIEGEIMVSFTPDGIDMIIELP